MSARALFSTYFLFLFQDMEVSFSLFNFGINCIAGDSSRCELKETQTSLISYRYDWDSSQSGLNLKGVGGFLPSLASSRKIRL
jgi:hypothetical protein